MSKLALVADRSPARAALADAISLVGKIRDAITARAAAKRSLPEDLAIRADEIAERLRKLEPDRAADEAHGDRRFNPGSFRSYAPAPEVEAPRQASPHVVDRIEALITGGSALDELEDELDAAAKEIAALHAEEDEIAAREKLIEGHNARVDEDVAELKSRLGYAEGDVRRAVDVVMRDEGGRDALIAAHARAVAIETVLRKAIEGAASPWIPGSPQQIHSFSIVTYAANRDAGPCLWGTAAERLRSDPDARMPTIADALATLPDVAPPAVGVGQSSARNAA